MNFHKLLRWAAIFLRQIFRWLLFYQRTMTFRVNAASLLKIAIVLGVFVKIDRGIIKLDSGTALNSIEQDLLPILRFFFIAVPSAAVIACQGKENEEAFTANNRPDAADFLNLW